MQTGTAVVVAGAAVVGIIAVCPRARAAVSSVERVGHSGKMLLYMYY